MPIWTFDIPTAAQAVRIVDALCGNYGYQATLDGVSNPETKQEFAQRMIRGHMKESVKTWESNQAEVQARVAARAKVESEINVT